MTLAKFSNRSFPTFPSLFNRLFEGDWSDPIGIGWLNSNFSSTNTSLPAVNVKEDDNKYLIDVAAPGMKKDDFKLNYDNGSLTISSEKKEENEENNGKYTRREFSYQSFQRTFNVPEDMIDSGKIEAKYDDGILHISLPKKEEAKPKPARSIKIS
ncbi:MAG: Hsp20/alpha crystallin family protein [Bacteroidales bacterium]|nr:Hsp20/alpha crystallin family protein [Bacteroidales bacterium]